MKKILPWMICLLWSGMAMAQETYILKGKVLDHRDVPLIGATIQIADSGKGTVTDEYGVFSLQVAKAELRIVFSYLGYQSQSRDISLPLEEELIVKLEKEAMGLEGVEVVSTGYQQISKERATGSFVHLDSSLIDRPVSTGILERLGDVTPGLIFNRNGPASDALSIRGRSTLFANSSPLIIVDGFPYDGPIENINPNDVESINVLRDAAAASIWGVKAGNGVIVISTKSGQIGSKPQVSLNSNVTVGEVFDPYYQPQMSVNDFIDTELMLFERGFYNSKENTPRKTALSPVVETLIAARNGEIDQSTADARIAAYRKQDLREAFLRDFYRKSINQQYALNISGGSERQSYFLTAGWDKNLETVKYRGMERFTLGGKQEIKLLKDRLKLSTGIYFTKTHQDRNGLAYGELKQSSNDVLAPYVQFRDENGNPMAITKDYRGGFLDGAEAEGLLDWRYNPLQDIHEQSDILEGRDIRMNLGLDYKIIKGLNAQVSYQYWTNEQQVRQHYGAKSYYARDWVNQYTQVDEEGNITRIIPEGGILGRSQYSSFSHNGRAQLNYKTDWEQGDWVSIAGAEVKSFESSSLGTRFYGYNDRVGNIAQMDYVNPYPVYYFPSASLRIPNGDHVGGTVDRYLSYYLNSAYTHQGKYTLSVSGRKDTSNLFGVDANQKGVPLWSLGAAWILSEEDFYPMKDWLPYAKLRFTYGYNGNIDKRVSAYTTAIRNGNSNITGLPKGIILNPPNPSLSWERIKIVNLGLDWATKDDRFSGTLEYYIKNGLDLIGDIPYAPSSGITEFRGNTASTQTHGLDFNISASVIRGAFQWRINHFHSWIKERVGDYELVGPVNQYLSLGMGGDHDLPIPLSGKPLYAIYSYAWAGLDPDTGDPLGYLDGEPSDDYRSIITGATPESLIYHGPSRPSHFGALRNDFSWQGWNLSFNISYRLGYYYRRNSVRYSTVLNAQGGHGDFALRWQNPGDETCTHVPSMPGRLNANRDNFYSFSSVLVEKGDHIRLQDIRLGYTFDQRTSPKLPFQRMGLYAYANNLGIIWKAAKDDPLDPDFRTAKPLKSIALGVKIDF
ncbi:SusC/RagA family TonB-linked outer membrane protein [Echinicola marina]|uniref:SusC/RagA family TonB-linked outer membrane protein n=1 Tax=Echinicola marina TaxID=2859768 RepID=UPI001CF6B98C|nr:SusC/RagA family TonB-linked outer membrane protein [Echinicola marina]UCS93958.1 SusC/RagA family TonB-linked outer membrane protein [Echinicola marina]